MKIFLMLLAFLFVPKEAPEVITDIIQFDKELKYAFRQYVTIDGTIGSEVFSIEGYVNAAPKMSNMNICNTQFQGAYVSYSTTTGIVTMSGSLHCTSGNIMNCQRYQYQWTLYILNGMGNYVPINTSGWKNGVFPECGKDYGLSAYLNNLLLGQSYMVLWQGKLNTGVMLWNLPLYFNAD